MIALASVVNEPSPRSRRVSFCRCIRRGLRTFWSLVAKCPCQNQVIRSVSGAAVATIRSSHQSVSVSSWRRNCCARAFLPTVSPLATCAGSGPRSGIPLGSGLALSNVAAVAAKPRVMLEP